MPPAGDTAGWQPEGYGLRIPSSFVRDTSSRIRFIHGGIAWHDSQNAGREFSRSNGFWALESFGKPARHWCQARIGTRIALVVSRRQRNEHYTSVWPLETSPGIVYRIKNTDGSDRVLMLRILQTAK
jgi:hypothetical protein